MSTLPTELMSAEKVYEPQGLDLPTDLQQRLTLTQRLRVMVLDDLTAGGTKLPAGEDNLKMMLEIARNMDVTTLGEMRAQVDVQNATNDQLVAAAILQVSHNRGRYAVPAEREIQARVIPPSPELDEPIELVPDETHIGLQTLTYEDFRERFGKK